MKITIKLGGPLRKKIEGHDRGLLVLDMPSESLISDVLYKLGLDLDEVRVIMKNGRAIHEDSLLVDGDRLGMFPREQAFNTMTAISFFNPLARNKKEKQ